MKETKKIPEYKLKQYKIALDNILNNNTILIASTKGFPDSNLQLIKKNLKKDSTILVLKKRILEKAIDDSKKPGIEKLKDYVTGSTCLIFSNKDPFDIAADLSKSKFPTYAKTGQISPESILIEQGPTELLPGPAISEFGSLGIKVAIEGGKITIKEPKEIVKPGQLINEKVAAILQKLNIKPFKIGLEPIVAYDSKSKKMYTEIKVNQDQTIKNLQQGLFQSILFAINIGYYCKETIEKLLAKANLNAKIIESKINNQNKQEVN